MKRILIVAFLLLLVATVASAQTSAAAGTAVAGGGVQPNSPSFTGQVQAGDGTISAPAYSFTNNTGIGFYRAGATDMRYASGGVDQIRFAPSFIVGAASGISFASTGVQSVNAAMLYDGASGVIGQRSGVTAQGFRVYNTFTDASNNELATIDWTTSANTLTFGAVANGTGTLRPLREIGSSIIFRTAAADKWTIASAGGLTANTDNSYDIGASGATRPRTLFTGTSVNSPTYLTTTNCSSGAGTCVAAPAGSVTVAAAATTVTVATTVVTANSQIILTRDNSLGTKLSVTCNTQSSLVLGDAYVSARTAGTSFVITLDVAPTTNPLCLSYLIVN